MAKFRRGNLDLNTNQQIRLGNSLESIIEFDGVNLTINSPNLTVDSGGITSDATSLTVGTVVLTDNAGVLDISSDVQTLSGSLTVGGVSGITVSGGDIVASHGQIDVGVDSSVKGTINVYGDNNKSQGAIKIYNGANYDTTVDYYIIGGNASSNENFYIGPSNAPTSSLQYTQATSAWQFGNTGGLIISGGDLVASHGQIDVGQSDNVRGIVNVYGASAGKDNATIRVYMGAGYDGTIDYFQIYTYQENFRIGPSTDPDAIEYAGGNNVLTLRPASGTTLATGADVYGGDLDVGRPDLERGIINVYGPNVGNKDGGTFRVYTGATYDGTIDYFQMYAYQDYLRIGPNTNPDSLTYSGAASTWDFTSGLVNLGVNDLTRGIAQLYGDNSGNGGTVRVFNPSSYDSPTDYYEIKAGNGISNGYLFIGPSTDLDSLYYNDSNSTWTFTASGGVDITSGALDAQAGVNVGIADSLSGTINVYSDDYGDNGLYLFVGGYYDTTTEYYRIKLDNSTANLHIGPSTDPDALTYLEASSRFDFTSPNGLAISGGEVYIGADDSVQGALYIYGSNSKAGGFINVYVGDTYDDTIDFYTFRIGSNSADLHIGPSNDVDSLAYIGSTGKWQFTGAGGVLIDNGNFHVDSNANEIELYRQETSGQVHFISDSSGWNLGVNDGCVWDITGATGASHLNSSGTLTISRSNAAQIKLTAGGIQINHSGATDYTMNTEANGIVVDKQAGTTTQTVKVGASDSRAGQLILYGDSGAGPTGGSINLYNASGYDGTYDYFSIVVGPGSTDYLEIGPSTDPDSLQHDSSGNWNFTAGKVNLGGNDTGAAAALNLYGGQSGNATLTIYFPADYDDTFNYFSFIASSIDTFEIGPNTDPDSLTYTSGGQWQFTGAAGISVTNSIDTGSLNVNSKKVSGQATTFVYGDTSVTDGDVALVDSTSVATISMTEAADAVITVKRIGNANVIVQGLTGLIDGVASKTLSARWQSITAICDGTDWFIIGETS